MSPDVSAADGAPESRRRGRGPLQRQYRPPFLRPRVDPAIPPIAKITTSAAAVPHQRDRVILIATLSARPKAHRLRQRPAMTPDSAPATREPLLGQATPVGVETSPWWLYSGPTPVFGNDAWRGARSADLARSSITQRQVSVGRPVISNNRLVCRL